MYTEGIILKSIKKIIAVLLAVMLAAVLFAGCSKKDAKATEITKSTLLIAYTEESAPFIYTDENGELAGFDVEIIANVFDSIKNEYKDYAFVQVDDGYVLNEDVAYTDDNGNEFSAIIMCGGTHKNVGTANEDVVWSKNIIENNIITVVAPNSAITGYNNIAGAKAGVVSAVAAAALDMNATIKNSLASVMEYATAEEAFAALNSGAIDAVVIDDFSYRAWFDPTSSSVQAGTVLPNVLDTIEYAFEFAPSNNYASAFNEAVKEMLSADYGDGDTLTPIVEKHFGYADACVFTIDEK